MCEMSGPILHVYGTGNSLSHAYTVVYIESAIQGYLVSDVTLIFFIPGPRSDLGFRGQKALYPGFGIHGSKRHCIPDPGSATLIFSLI
jgi:hypothetical protein